MKRVLIGLLGFWLATCTPTNEVVEQVSLAVQNLPPLQGAYYELWVTFYQFNNSGGGDSPEHEGEYVSIGSFSVAADGTLRMPSGGTATFLLPPEANTQLLKDIVVSVQTRPTEQPQSIVIGGAFTGDATTARADLHMAYRDAFGVDFSHVTGTCTIVAPTSPSDSNSGAWFVELGSTTTPGIRNLPALPSGWQYEGWVVRTRTGSDVTYLSTGKFLRADSADFDGPGPFAGTAGQPFNYPGQDFVQGSGAIPDLRNGEYSFMVTIEPANDNSQQPFFLTLLKSLQPASQQSRAVVLSNLIDVSAPRGKVVIRR